MLPDWTTTGAQPKYDLSADAEGKLWIEPTAASIVAAITGPIPGNDRRILPLACLFDDAHDFGLQLLDVLAHEAKLLDQLGLFQHQTPLPSQAFDADALRGQALQFQEFGVGERTGTDP